jgi:hypothetical protein
LAQKLARRPRDGKQGIEVGPEATAYAADRLASKIERGGVYNPVAEAHAGILAYHALKERRGGRKVAYFDVYKLRRERLEAESKQEKPKQDGPKQDGPKQDGPKQARAKKPLPSPESGAEQLDLNEQLYAREWLYAQHYVRKYVTATIAQSKIGKSLTIMMECLAMASGRGDIPHRLPGRNLSRREKLRVLYVNGEDPIEEVKLRFRALAQHFGVSQEDLKGWLFIGSGRKTDFVVARDEKGAFRSIEPVVEAVVETIRTLKVDVLIVDPLVAFHNIAENDNSKMDAVIQLFKDIADECDIAVEIVAHTRKTNGEPVTTQDFRGAGGQVGGVRAVRTVNLMAETEGKSAGLEPDEFRWLIRLDNDSANMSEPGGGGTQWLRKVSVEVPVVDKKTGKATTEKVGVVEAWYWPSKEDVTAAKEKVAEAKAEVDAETLTPELTDAIIGAVCEAKRSVSGSALRADMRSSDWAGYAIMPAVGLSVADKDDKSQMNAWLKLLVKSDDLTECTSISSRRHPALFLDISEKTRNRLHDDSER